MGCGVSGNSEHGACGGSDRSRGEGAWAIQDVGCGEPTCRMRLINDTLVEMRAWPNFQSGNDQMAASRSIATIVTLVVISHSNSMATRSRVCSSIWSRLRQSNFATLPSGRRLYTEATTTFARVSYGVPGRSKPAAIKATQPILPRPRPSSGPPRSGLTRRYEPCVPPPA